MREDRRSQINNLNLPISIRLDHNVLRLKIRMYNMQLMQLTDSLKQLSSNDLKVSQTSEKLW